MTLPPMTSRAKPPPWEGARPEVSCGPSACMPSPLLIPPRPPQQPRKYNKKWARGCTALPPEDLCVTCSKGGKRACKARHVWYR